MKRIYSLNKNIAIIIAAFMLLLLAAPAKANCDFHANFSFSATSANCKTIVFTNTSYVTNSNDSGVSYFWRNGSAAIGSTKNLTYTFSANGTYNICLIMFKQTNGGICSDTICKTVTINCGSCNFGNVGWNWTYNCSNRTVTYTGSNSDSTGTYRYTWGFGDQHYDTLNHKSTTHMYPNNGTYTVCLNIKKFDGGTVCRDTTICKTVTVGGVMASNFTFTQSSANCKEFVFAIQDSNSCGNYLWSWGDGSTSTQANKNSTIGHSYASSGTYTVCLKVRACNDSTCFQYTCKTITVNCGGCSTYANWGFNVSCPSRTVTFTSGVGDSTGNYNYLWTFGDNTTATTANATHTYASNGTYTVCLRIKRFANSNTPCFDTTICKTVTVNCNNTSCPLYAGWSYNIACPSRIGTFNSFVGDSSGAYAYQWTFGDNTGPFNGQNKTHTFLNNGTYTVCLSVKRYIPGTTTVCKDTTICKTVTVNCSGCNLTPSFSFGVNCSLRKVELQNSTTGDSCFTSKWSWGDGTYSNDRHPAPHVYAQPGTYTICLLVKKCNDTTCVKDICKTVVIPNSCCNSRAYFGASVKCADKKVEVLNYSYGDSCMTYKWTWGDGTSSTAKNPVKHIYNAPGTYTICLKVTKCNDSSCFNTFCKTIVIPNTCCPTPNFYWYNFCNTFRFINTTVGGTSYWWSFGDSSFSAAKSPYHAYFKKRTYTVCLTVFDSVKHCSSTVCKTVTVNCRWFGNHFEVPLGDDNIGSSDALEQADGSVNTDLTPSKGLQVNENAGISAYPNPTNSYLNIVLPASNATVKITDITGAVLMQFENVSSFIKADVSKLAAGVYFVNVVNENGLQSVRFMKN